jgi:hypothetical protein
MSKVLKLFLIFGLCVFLISCRYHGHQNQFKPKVKPSTQFSKDLEKTSKKQTKRFKKDLKKNKKKVLHGG